MLSNNNKPDKSRLKLAKKRKLSDEERFPNLDETEIKEIRDSTKKINTERSDKKCEKIFVAWLNRHNFEPNYWTYSVEDLNEKLSKFWFEARAQDGSQYTTATLGHIRYGLNRCLSKHESRHDIVDGADFKDSSKAFFDACKKLKDIGKGYRQSYQAITPKGNDINMF